MNASDCSSESLRLAWAANPPGAFDLALENLGPAEAGRKLLVACGHLEGARERDRELLVRKMVRALAFGRDTVTWRRTLWFVLSVEGKPPSAHELLGMMGFEGEVTHIDWQRYEKVLAEWREAMRLKSLP